jgi:hypothetical protein
VRFSLGPVNVELLFKKFVDSFVDLEGWTAGAFDFEPSIQPKTTLALHK